MKAIEFRGISKCFKSFRANHHLSFSVQSGTIHGLIGENGAGKSTAMKVLFGIHSPEEGEIQVKGKTVQIKNPIHAMKLGIGMVHQHFMLAERETVLDNIILGQEPSTFGWIHQKTALEELKRISKAYGLHFDRWDSPIQELSVGEQQRVEIIKLLYQKSEVLILDEPTAVLTPQEVKELFTNLQRLKGEGKTIILISHKLKEVLEFTDEVTVMRRGTAVGTCVTAETNEDELAEMMVGRKVSFTYQGIRKLQASRPKPVLKVSQLTTKTLHEPLHHLALEVAPGEILGIAGIQGNGQSPLLHYLSHPAKFNNTETSYTISGQDVSHAGPVELARLGVSLVPADRLSEAVLLEQSMVDNFLLGQHRDPRYVRGGMIRRGELEDQTRHNIEAFDVRPTNPSTRLSAMSGGNQQKLVMARAMDSNPKVLLVAHPTRGVDVGAIECIHEAIMNERNDGKAIIMISSELDELIDLADRIVVLFEGKIVKEFARNEFDSWAIGKAMGGGE